MSLRQFIFVKPGHQNTQVTEAWNKVAHSFNCMPIDSMLSHQLKQHVIDGEKTIIQNPTDSQKKDHEKAEFEVHEAYAVDALVSSGEGKVKADSEKTSMEGGVLSKLYLQSQQVDGVGVPLPGLDPRGMGQSTVSPPKSSCAHSDYITLHLISELSSFKYSACQVCILVTMVDSNSMDCKQSVALSHRMPIAACKAHDPGDADKLHLTLQDQALLKTC
ncbi:hypothetical protein STEG23_013130 [Scotinomys teguina]